MPARPSSSRVLSPDKDGGVVLVSPQHFLFKTEDQTLFPSIGEGNTGWACPIGTLSLSAFLVISGTNQSG